MPLNTEILKKYKKNINVFIETGTLHGEGIDCALISGFKSIYSIELSGKLYNNCVKKYGNNENVNLYKGDSAKYLINILFMIKEPALFWLDAHYSGGMTVASDKKCPVLDELEAIKKHSIKTHIILIDDVRLFGTEAHDNITILDIVSKLKEINIYYKIVYEKDILVAYLGESNE